MLRSFTICRAGCTAALRFGLEAGTLTMVLQEYAAKRRCCFQSTGRDNCTSSRSDYHEQSRTQASRDNPADVAALADDIFSLGNKHLKTVEEIATLPEGLHSFPEVCFIGKPNCGKSTVIGALCHNYRMGRSGRRPGQTTKLEFFNVGDALLLVDTPGYGSWKRSIAQQAVGVTNLKRYLSLRTRQGNLKQAYWVMECSSAPPAFGNTWMRLQPRDEELLEFLMFEKVPFTVVLNKTDKLPNPDVNLSRCVEDVWRFIGSDKVPILDIAARPSPSHWSVLATGKNRNFRRSDHAAVVEAPRNMEALRCDMVYHCCSDLRPGEPLTLQSIRSLSYLPPSAQDLIDTELRYPFGTGLLPVKNSEQLESFVARHNAAKLGLANHVLNGHSGKVISEKALGDVLQLGAASQVDVKAAMTEIVSRGSPSLQSSVVALDSAASPIHENAVAVTSDIAADTLATTSKQDEDVFNGELFDGGASFLSAQKAVKGYCTSVIGVPIPSSMVVPSIEAAAKKMERSAEAYAEMVEHQGYGGVISSDEEFFVARGAPSRQDYLGEREGQQKLMSMQPSQRKLSTDRMINKFVLRQRKERSISLDAHGYRCPWLGGSGQRAVLHGDASLGTGSGAGRVVRGLKKSGFGGMSLTAKTLKNRGRATKKTGSWAT